MHDSDKEIKSPGRDSREAAQNTGPGMSKRIWLVVIIVLLAGAFAYYKSRNDAQTKAASPQGPGSSPVISIGVAPVQKKDVPYFLTGLGSVTAYNTVTVHSRVDGQIMQVHFTEGQFVKAGDLLIEIDPRPFQVGLAQAEGQLAKDQASQNDAKIDLGRYQTL